MFKNTLNECSAYSAFRIACLFNAVFPEENAHGINRKDLFSASTGLLMLASVTVNLSKDFLKNSGPNNDPDPLKCLALLDTVILHYMSDVIAHKNKGLTDINEIAKAAISDTYMNTKAMILPMIMDGLQNALPGTKFEDSASILKEISENGVRSVLDTVMSSDDFEKLDRDIAANMVVSLFGDLDPLCVGMAACRVRELQVRALNMLEDKSVSMLPKILSGDLPKDIMKRVSSPNDFAAYLCGEVLKEIAPILDTEFEIPDPRIRKFVEMHLYATFTSRHSVIATVISAKLVRQLIDMVGMSMKYSLAKSCNTIWPDGIPDNMTDLVGNAGEVVSGYNPESVTKIGPEKCHEFVTKNTGGLSALEGFGGNIGLSDIFKGATSMSLKNIKGALGDAEFDRIIMNKHTVDVTSQRAVVNLCLDLTRIFAEENAGHEIQHGKPDASESKKEPSSEEAQTQKNTKRMFN